MKPYMDGSVEIGNLGGGAEMLFETDTIICRNFKSEDFNDIQEYASDINVVKYMVWGPNSEEDTKTFIKEAMKCVADQPRLKYELAIIDKKYGNFIGGIALYILSEANSAAEIGYCINPKYWGKGYATDATKAILEFGFKKLKLHRIEATCDVRNLGSSRVLEKAGLKREGIIRDHILLRDGWRNSYLYSILEHEY